MQVPRQQRKVNKDSRLSRINLSRFFQLLRWQSCGHVAVLALSKRGEGGKMNARLDLYRIATQPEIHATKTSQE
jgi:hypothetical protein